MKNFKHALFSSATVLGLLLIASGAAINTRKSNVSDAARRSQVYCLDLSRLQKICGPGIILGDGIIFGDLTFQADALFQARFPSARGDL